MREKVAIITGAGRGLGRAYARYFALQGAKVIVNTRSKPVEASDSAEAVAEEIRRAGACATAMAGDVEDPQLGERLLACALERYGRCDILLNNAGVPEAKPLHRQTLEEFHAVFGPNFLGVLHTTRPIYCHMRERGYGRIVMSTSAAGLYGIRGMPAYSAAKAAVIGLMRSLALEIGTLNLRCNALAPYADTRMTAEYLPETVKPLLEPAYVAPVAAWLCSEDCAVNGEVFVAGAGRVCRAATFEGEGILFEPPQSLTPERLAQCADAARSLRKLHSPANGNDAFQSFLKFDGVARPDPTVLTDTLPSNA